MSKSVTNATKAKFDSLLKLALSKKSSNVNKSTQNLLEKTNLNVNVEEVTLNESSCSNDRSFILDRFLNDNAVEETSIEKEVVVIKAPVPKPRRRQSIQQNSDSSKDTFVVKSVTEELENHNDDSDKTFVVIEPVNRRDSIVSNNSSARTYILKNEVGDVLLHSPKPTNALHVVDVNNKSNEKNNDPPRPKPRCLSKETKRLNSDIVITKNEDEPKSDVQDLEVEEISSSKTKVDYVDERKPKKPKRRKDKAKVENITDVFTYEKILSIVVHRTDALNLKSFVVHPLVKIHILDAETGAYLKKSNKSRSCVYSEENNDITYLLPVLTQSFNLQTKRSIYPDWEESIVINEDFNYMTNPKQNVIIFFEIVDFVSTSTDTRKGWHGIAWAFLKVTGKNNSMNINRKLRLQLYELDNRRKVLQTKCDLYDWWREKKLKKYPSTLYVTLKSIPPPDIVAETLRSKTQGKKCLSVPCERLQNEDDKSCEKGEDERKDAVTVNLPKLRSEICKIPNKILAELKNEDEGCFVLKFSNGGAYLACAVFADDMYNILVYSTSNFEEFYKLPTHQMLIYNIKWSMDDSLLLSASADATVCIWNMKNFNLMQILPHPSYVYCTEISAEGIIATGCYDNTLRIWVRTTNETDFSLYEELEGHDGYITSVCFTKDSRIVFSSDSVGCIIEWGKVDGKWSLIKAIRIPELREVVINQLILHKKEKRLIVHARDSVIRIIDIKNSCTIQWLEGATNSRMQTTCCVTRCCSYVLAGGEDGKIHIWNLDTGKSKALYRPYKDLSAKDLAIHCVDFHPSENILAFAHYGHGIPVFVYGYEKNNKDVNLTVTKPEETEQQIKDELYHPRKLRGRNSHKPEKKMLLKDILEKMDELIVTSNLH